jgi:nucleotide-binding universal stress UspA family protein
MGQRSGAPAASTYKRILVPIDGSRGATIRLLHVLEPLPALQGMEVIITETLLDNMTSFGEKILQNAQAIVESHGNVLPTA